MRIPGLKTKVVEAFEEVISLFPQEAQERTINKSYYSHLFILSKIEELMPNMKGKVILDVGAGAGLGSLTLRKLGATVSAVDTWSEYSDDEDNPIGNLAEILPRYDEAQIERHECDIMKAPLPYDDESFDMVIFSNVLEHLHGSPKYPLEQMVRVLKPGGVLLLAVPNISNLRWRVKLLFGKSPFASLDLWYLSDPFRAHVREYTPEEIRTIFQWLGLNLVNMWMNDGLIWNTKIPTDSYPIYQRGVKITSLFQLAKIPYFILTTLIPNLRYGIVAAGAKPVI